MIDSLLRLLSGRRGDADTPGRLGVPDGRYVLVTLHRPALVDDPAQLDGSDGGARRTRSPGCRSCSRCIRARAHASRDAGTHRVGGCPLLEPLVLHEFVALQAGARLVITDSGGVQEETSALGVPA